MPEGFESAEQEGISGRKPRIATSFIRKIDDRWQQVAARDITP
jgi:hypothetical protein